MINNRPLLITELVTKLPLDFKSNFAKSSKLYGKF